MRSVWNPVYKLLEKSFSVKLINFAKYMFDIFREKLRLICFVKLLDEEHTFTLLFYEPGGRMMGPVIRIEQLGCWSTFEN